MKLLKILSIILFFTLIFSCDAGGTEVNNNNNGTENPDNPDNGGDDNGTLDPVIPVEFVVSKDIRNISESDINSIYVDDTSIYLGTNSNGIYISNNNGENWENLTELDGLSSNDIDSISKYNNYLIVCSFKGISIINLSDKTEIYNYLKYTEHYNLVKVHSDRIYIGSTYNGLIISSLLTDGISNLTFETKTVKEYTGESYDYIDSLYFDSGKLYIGSWDFILTTDELFSTPPQVTDLNIGTVHINGIIKQNDRLFVNSLAIYYSDDNSATFNHYEKYYALGTNSTEFVTIDNKIIVTSKGYNLYYSDNNGDSWIRVGLGEYETSWHFSSIKTEELVAYNGFLYFAHEDGLLIAQLK